jgi:carboxylesterase
MNEAGSEVVQARGPAVLLVHGFNGGPLDMSELEERLRAEGFSTRNLLLPGHGSGARALARTTWSDWTRAVQDAVEELRDRHGKVVLIGHSMGAALALHTAANASDVAGVVALCPPLRMFFGEARVAALARRVAPYLPSLREDIYDPEARRRYRRSGSRWTPLEAAHSLLSSLPALRAQLGSVTCPALVMCARRDHVVPVRDGIEVFNLLGTSAKELHVLQRSYHVVTKDVEREIVTRHVTDFARRVTAPIQLPQEQAV